MYKIRHTGVFMFLIFLIAIVLVIIDDLFIDHSYVRTKQRLEPTIEFENKDTIFVYKIK